jgi:arginyl-tRNA synthetase
MRCFGEDERLRAANGARMKPIVDAERGMLPDDALRSFAQALRERAAVLYPGRELDVVFEAPRRPEFGEYATNAAFSLARTAQKPPQEVAKALIAGLESSAPRVRSLVATIEPVAGFINLRLSPTVWHNAVAHIVRDRENFARASHRGTRISLEFGSANPTGPLVVVQGRALSIGDVLARTMRLRGYDVFVEWIINDTGGQFETLGRSLYARYRQMTEPEFPFPEDGYAGEYLVPIAQRLRERDGDRWEHVPESEAIERCARFGRDEIVGEQRQTAERFGVRYDLWQSERELHETGRVEAGIARLQELGLTYTNEGALFFRATQFGDDKDRVLVRADGRPTYYAADVAYHYEKLSRAERVIDILGPDHHGYIGRLKGIAGAFGFPDRLEVLISQHVTLMRGSEQVAMSKRAGQVISLDEVIDEVGVDAARFFFTMLSTDQPLTFDMKLAVEQTEDNPVYYVQYGHARISSVLRKAEAADVSAAADADLSRLVHPKEIALARRLAALPRLAQDVVNQLAPYRLVRYARDVAADFHQFYGECRILDDDRDLRLARLALCLASRTVLALTLDLLGVKAPEMM